MHGEPLTMRRLNGERGKLLLEVWPLEPFNGPLNVNGVDDHYRYRHTTLITASTATWHGFVLDVTRKSIEWVDSGCQKVDTVTRC